MQFAALTDFSGACMLHSPEGPFQLDFACAGWYILSDLSGIGNGYAKDSQVA
jgi:hypothetical protein